MNDTLVDGRRLVLGSGSAFRKTLLERLGLPFQVDAPDIDETAGVGESPPDLVRRLAREKALAVAARHTDALIIGSDQVADLDGEILTKPNDHAVAICQLERVSGHRIAFRTGLCLVDTTSGHEQADVVSYSVRFRNLSSAQIEHYLRRERPYDCAGSFRSEGLGIALLESMSGEDPNALVGLPLIRLVTMLSAEGIAVL